MRLCGGSSLLRTEFEKYMGRVGLLDGSDERMVYTSFDFALEILLRTL